MLFKTEESRGDGMIATIGEALVDFIEQPDGAFRACLGGSVLNFTLGLARQGVSTYYLNALSEDRFGQAFARLLVDHKVQVPDEVRSAFPTSIAVVSIDENGQPSYSFHRERVADRDLTSANLVARLPENTQLLHTGGLTLVPDDLNKTIAVMDAAILRGTMVSIDVNIRTAVVSTLPLYLRGVQRVIKRAHIVKASVEDLATLGMDVNDLTGVTRQLFSGSMTEFIVITKGAGGAMLATRNCSVEMPSPANLDVIDTVGAGDCFHSALIAHLQKSGHLQSPSVIAQIHQDRLRSALRHAIAAASINIMRAGCNPATWEETLAFQETLPH